jgi:hypothetical protein
MGNLPEREGGGEEGARLGCSWGGAMGRGRAAGGGCAVGTQPCCSSIGSVFCVLYVREGRKEEGERRRKKGRKRKEKRKKYGKISKLENF